MRRALPALLALALAAPAAAQGTGAAATIDERIDFGLGAKEETIPQSLVPPAEPEKSDVSLAAPTGATTRLRTTLDPLDIEQRIDKGLTAAGEESTFPADYAFGAFQRGWFLTAFSLALDRAKVGDAPAQTLLGVLLSRGLGVKQDLPAAADWYGLAGRAAASSPP